MRQSKKGLFGLVLLKDRLKSYVYIVHIGLMGGMKRHDKGKEKVEEPKEKEKSYSRINILLESLMH